MTDPRYCAFHAVASTMAQGSAKDGTNDTWREKPKEYHLLKAIRHATTGLMIERGICPPDDDNHLANALTRLAMALAQDESHGAS